MQDVVTVKGARIPKVGCGTWELRGPTCAEIVSAALRLGFRHIDTAQGYDNEREVGEGIRASGVPREEIFITTKVRPQVTGEGLLQRSVEESLERLGVDTIDMLLLHWPNPQVEVAESVKALSDAKQRGMTRHIGVSNFTIALLDRAMRLSPEPLANVQIEYHPYLDQTRLLETIRRHGLAITAYCPIALGKAARDLRLAAIGSRYGKTAAQVALRWLVQQPDVIVIPRTSKKERLKENLEILDFQLTAAEMDEISQMQLPNSRLINEPQWVPRWD